MVQRKHFIHIVLYNKKQLSNTDEDVQKTNLPPLVAEISWTKFI